MQKKVLFVATGLIMSSPVYSAEFTYYAGAALAQTNLEADFDFDPSTPSSGTSGDDSDRGLRLFGGVTRDLGRGYIGAELAVEDGGSEVERNFSRFGQPNAGQRGVIEDDRSYSLSFIGGFELQENTRLYGRIGYVTTEFDYETLSSGDRVVDSGDDTFSAVQYALGADFQVSQTLAVRVEFSSIRYSDDVNLTANVTGDLAEFDNIARDAVSIGVFKTF